MEGVLAAFAWFDNGHGFVGTVATTTAFSYLPGFGAAKEGLVDQNIASWNQVAICLRQLEALQHSARTLERAASSG